MEATFLFITRARPIGDIVTPAETANLTDSLREMGMMLFNQYLLPFEVTSVLLLVAMVGAIVLVSKERRVHQ